MKIRRGITLMAVVCFLLSGAAGAADLKRAKGTVNNIRQAEPPKVSTTTKPSPVGQPAKEYKPKGPSVHPKAPPKPARNLNPQNDPQVQKGYNKHQKAHGR